MRTETSVFDVQRGGCRAIVGSDQRTRRLAVTNHQNLRSVPHPSAAAVPSWHSGFISPSLCSSVPHRPSPSEPLAFLTLRAVSLGLPSFISLVHLSIHSSVHRAVSPLTDGSVRGSLCPSICPTLGCLPHPQPLLWGHRLRGNGCCAPVSCGRTPRPSPAAFRDGGLRGPASCVCALTSCGQAANREPLFLRSRPFVYTRPVGSLLVGSSVGGLGA